MARTMAAQLEQLADDRVRITVDVPAHDVQHAVDHTANDLSESVKIPGFRRGKVPRPILVQRIGKERLYSEAVDNHITSWFWSAASRMRVNPVAQPEYDYELPRDDKQDWRFSATVAVQPKPEPADWTQLEVPKPEAEVPEEAVQGELEALQRIVAELIPVEGRAAHDGDTVVVDIASAGEAQRDVVVDLGAERLVEEIENAIRGLSAGETRDVAYEIADGSTRNAAVTVKEIKERVLPPVDDELARAATEFESIAELRADIEGRLRDQIDAEIDVVFRAAAVDVLVEASNVEAKGPLVELRTRELVNGLVRSLEGRGIDAATYLSVTGQSPEALEQRLRAEATQSVARELVLEAVADKLRLEVSDEEIRSELREAGETDDDIEAFVARGGADSIRDDLRLKKALDRVAAEVKPIAPELHEARESIWTPGQEAPAAEKKLWTPASKE